MAPIHQPRDLKQANIPKSKSFFFVSAFFVSFFLYDTFSISAIWFRYPIIIGPADSFIFILHSYKFDSNGFAPYFKAK